ncbi:MAG: transglycosylase SLT domain-containing protein [Gammaproteobacteria bacterium]|jgi:soluble lytic murein transglycosylase|nr:transglycosylase SLT domain-containing protein [Gammaproteobacteria bacterium]
MITEIVGITAIVVAAMLGSPAQASIEQQRQLFHDASYALETNQISKFNRLLKQLDDYPAQAYLEYDAFRRNISRLKPQQVELFLQRYADYPFAYHARGSWLDILARRGDWEGYLKYFDDRANTRLQCISFQARLKLGQLDGLNEEISRIWLRGYSQPPQCDAAFSYYLDSQGDPEQVIWARIEKAFKARRPALALYLGKKLDAQSRATVESWYRAHKRPEQSLKQLTESEDNERTRDIIVHAIDRLARKNSLRALEAWNQISDQFAFTPEHKAQVQLRIALSAALQHESEARDLLSGLDAEAMNDQAYLWLARIQLRGRDWSGLLNTINRMPAHLYEENEWQYWLSRSMEAEGQLSGSLTLLEQLSGKSSYYGFLAADKLKREYLIEQENAASTGVDEDAFLAENPHMLRARELFFLDRLVDAKREWFQALRYLDQDQIKQAATLASRWQWHDSAIRTVAKTKHRSDYSLRFPMPYKQQVLENAQARELDPSLIYGVMRRESLFDPLARSSVGALGLMQLMPSTARRVASSLGMKRPRKSDILSVENNIRFGTQYLRNVMNRFDNNVALAAAAYNAGPGNVKKWLPREQTMSADLWVETVPFKETRNYVQAVLAYSTVFDRSLGKDTLMSSRMNDIKPRY